MHRVALALALTVPAVGCSRHNAAPAPAAATPAAQKAAPPQVRFGIRAIDPRKPRTTSRRLI